MSRDFPALADLWQLVNARRGFRGSWPVERFTRLADQLESTEGQVDFVMQFGVDDLGVPFCELQIEGELMLQCQRSLQPFAYQVDREVLLGLIANEADEAALPEGYEPLLVPDEPFKLMDLLEDELILSLPVVAVADGEPLEWSTGENLEVAEKVDSPFSQLSALKQKNKDK